MNLLVLLFCCCCVPETLTLAALLLCRDSLVRRGRALVSDSAAGRVAVLDGSFAEVGSLGGSGGLSSPAGVAAGSDGWVYVAEAGRSRVAIFDEALAFVGSFPAAPAGDGAPGGCPRAIEVLLMPQPGPNQSLVRVLRPDSNLMCSSSPCPETSEQEPIKAIRRDLTAPLTTRLLTVLTGQRPRPSVCRVPVCIHGRHF